jgi:hypothetical protein
MAHMIPNMPNRTIATFLTSPCKVAKKLNWKKNSGCILSLSVLKDRLDIVISSHPQLEKADRLLPSIYLKKRSFANTKTLDPSVPLELASIITYHNICGMVVSWPVQKEGWCGAPCGRVLHFLDQIAAYGNVLSTCRPMCLYDVHHHLPNVDSWGRNPIFGDTQSSRQRNLHLASIEQYQDAGVGAVDVWNNFLVTHWPDWSAEHRDSSKLHCGKKDFSCVYTEFGEHNFVKTNFA